MGTLPGGSASLESFDGQAQHWQPLEKTDAVTPLDIIALKAHVTQLVVNQAEMAQLLANDCSADSGLPIS
jgi:hypothetical protein